MYVMVEQSSEEMRDDKDLHSGGSGVTTDPHEDVVEELIDSDEEEYEKDQKVSNDARMSTISSNDHSCTCDDQEYKKIHQKVSNDAIAPESSRRPIPPPPLPQLSYRPQVVPPHSPLKVSKRSDHPIELLSPLFAEGDHEFGRYMNRHDLFAMTTFNVHEGQDEIIASNGGGGGGGNNTRQVSLGVSSNNGGKVFNVNESIGRKEGGSSKRGWWKKAWLKLTGS